ncbi:MAG: M48 family metalloprotease [Verrucomicrobiales bacterium]|nr:M48 family metalloprotease [Verrucomicrobiales bacterium]
MSGLFYNLGRRLGRATIPAIRKSRWVMQNLTGDEDETLASERSFGTALATELRGGSKPARDPECNRLVADICRKLHAGAQDKRRRFHAEAIQLDPPNAMALPGGFIFISESLIEFCGRQSAELAFVIGHEMGHVLRGHAWDRMVSQTASRVASAVTLRAGPLGQWLRQSGLGLLQNAHARDAEAEADIVGVRLAVAGGFYAGGAITLLRRLEQLQPDEAGSLGTYFSSHPPPGERLAALLPVCHKLGGS